jgi:phospholipase/carboxylesterase
MPGADAEDPVERRHSTGRLTARPRFAPPPPAPRDDPEIEWPLGRAVGAPMLFVPRDLPDAQVPLVVLLHGAGATPSGILPLLQDEARRRSLLVLAPKSADRTWDVIRGAFGRDVGVLDESLTAVFERFPVDPQRVAVAGFSDGASYALSLGLINGDLFRRIMAFSPGFVVASSRVDRPSIFVSHGTADAVLPIGSTSRRLVPALRSEGYEVDYREFAGGHDVPAELVQAALDPLEPRGPQGSRGGRG